jgi:hypothetical protein
MEMMKALIASGDRNTINVSLNYMRLFIFQILISTIILTTACNDQSRAKSQATSSQDSILNGMTKAKENGQKVEGKFIRIQRLTDRTYALSIQINLDSIVVFETFMPLNDNEIQLLKKMQITLG